MLQDDFNSFGINFYEVIVESEPSPDLVDEITEEFREKAIHCILSIGGGSVIDAGKAVSAMVPQEGSVLDYLEGIGKRKHNGVKVPFIAVPTTSGTGSEATKNAVLSSVGKKGYKRSIRHDNLFADAAIIDPELTVSCPPGITAGCGMDALAQLIESYISVNASPFTDALVESALGCAGAGLVESFIDGENIDARSNMSYAAYVSGVALANAGLGTVHGIAGPMGGIYNIPHGAACGAITPYIMEEIVRGLKNAGEPGKLPLQKLSRAGKILSLKDPDAGDLSRAEDLIEKLFELKNTLKIRGLGYYGLKENDLKYLAGISDNKLSPFKLDAGQIEMVLKKSI